MAKSNLKKRTNEPTYFPDETDPKKPRLSNKFSKRCQLPQKQEELGALEKSLKLRKETLLKEQEELDELKKSLKLREETLLKKQKKLDALEKSLKLREEPPLKEQEELDALELSSQDSYTDSVKSMELSDDLDEAFAKPKSLTNFVNKTNLKKVLSSILNVELDDKVLVDFIFGDKTVIVGRAKIKGTSKQLNHIVPHSLIEHS
jgi:exonuclease VII large subunit